MRCRVGSVVLTWCLCAAPPLAEDEDDNRYAQEEFGEQPFQDHGYEDLADAASGKGAFDVMLTTYTLFERVGASNRCAAVRAVGQVDAWAATAGASCAVRIHQQDSLQWRLKVVNTAVRSTLHPQ
eukprot:GHRQ01028894.1.p2 GENE.GHRQ01028894.1~~GHRQ01028894.1.p2  ORF type:complete len:125 (-),score=38.65 GHRQ01028894.1:483-857(-)